MSGSNRTTILILTVLVLVAVLLTNLAKRTEAPQVPNDKQEQVITSPQAVADATTFSPISLQQGERISYGAALRAFVGTTFQFDANCRARPATMAVEIRDQILLDNQSSKQRTVSVGNRIYVIPAYNFAIVSMPRVGTFPLSCDDTENVAVVGVR